MPVLCPIALAIGCRKCPIFSVCPVKTTIGDYVPPKPAAAAAAKPKKAASAAKVAPRKSKKRGK